VRKTVTLRFDKVNRQIARLMSYGEKAFGAQETGEELMTARGAAPGRYRAAVIGCGAIGSTIEDDIATANYRMGLPYGHAPVYASLARTELVAGADNDAGRRQAFAARWGLADEKVYADYREMLANERIDIVSIATPTPLHAEMTLAAIDAGVKAIFLEKPLASRLADADRLIAACREAGIPLSINHTRRGDAHYRKARRLIENGVIGPLHSLVANLGGHLMLSASHAFDLMNYLNGDRRTAWMTGTSTSRPASIPAAALTSSTRTACGPSSTPLPATRSCSGWKRSAPAA
jgi:predicted dehydrogenase